MNSTQSPRGHAGQGGGRSGQGRNSSGQGRNSSDQGRDRTQRYRNERGHERSGSRGRGGKRQGWSSSRPSQRQRAATGSRRVAFEGMRAVREDGAYANLILPKLQRSHRLDARDAAFSTELFYGTLRSQSFLDAIIAECTDRPLDQIEGAVLDILRLGVHQLIGMHVAPHAATSETVALAREAVGSGAASFVNAVLRRAGERDRETWCETVVPAREDDEVKHLALRYSHPAWIVRALQQALVAHGRDPSEIDALLASHNDAPRVSLVMRPGLTDEDEMRAGGAGEGRWSIFACSWPEGDPGRLAPVAEGRAAVQDEGSQLMALALGLGADSLVAENGRWLDLCAGPGGKSALLAGLTPAHDAELLAVEVAEHRTRLVERSVRALVEAGVEVTAITADGRTIGDKHPAEYSRVMADVPCSGLGALRRRPEARWRRQPADLAEMAPLQRDLLASALDAVAPGGVVAYVTCSPHLSETRLVVQDVLRGRDDIEQLDARDAVRAGVLPARQAETDLGQGPTVQLWPHIHGTDAMFLALLRKQPADAHANS